MENDLKAVSIGACLRHRAIAALVLAFACMPFAITLWATAYTVVYLHQTTFTADSTQFNGDTDYCAANQSPSTDGGPWNGGVYPCTMGDGFYKGVGGHVIALKLNTYDPTNISGTNVTGMDSGSPDTNTLTGWGPAGVNDCMGLSDGENTSSGDKPIFIKHMLYWPIRCQYAGEPFTGTKFAWIVSPDLGIHFCNLANFTEGGSGGSNTCDSVNWSSTGDKITGTFMTYGGHSHLAVPWDTGGFPNTLKVSRAFPIAWGQDTTASGPTIPSGVDPLIDTSYTYVMFPNKLTTSDNTILYLGRFVTAAVGGPMLLANWQWWNNGTWDSNYGNVTGIPTGDVPMLDVYGWDTFYHPTLKKYFARVVSPFVASGGAGTIAVASFPWGPWAALPAASTTPSIPTSTWSGWMPPTFVDAGSSFQISMTNDNSPAFANGLLAFSQIQIMLPPPTGTFAGKLTINGTVRIQ